MLHTEIQRQQHISSFQCIFLFSICLKLESESNCYLKCIFGATITRYLHQFKVTLLMIWSVLPPSSWQTFPAFPLSSGRTFGATQILLKLILCTNKMCKFSSRSSCQTTSCKAARVLPLAQGMCGSDQDGGGAWEPCGEEERWPGRHHPCFPGGETPLFNQKAVS